MARSLQWPFQERVSSQTGSSLNPGSMTPFEQTGIEIMLIFGRGCMNRTLITVSLTFFSAVMTKAQSEFIPTNLPLTSVQPLQLIPVPGKPTQPESQEVLPNAPIPVLPGVQDGPLPCPAGIGKPCPLL